MDNNGQQWATMSNNGQQWTTMDNNGQQSAVLHASLHSCNGYGLLDLDDSFDFKLSTCFDLKDAMEAMKGELTGPNSLETVPFGICPTTFQKTLHKILQ